MAIRRVDVPDRIKESDRIGVGISSWVYRLDAVVKCYTEPAERDREIAVYERLGSHKSILQYYGLFERSILLRFASNRTMRQHLSCTQHNPPLCTRLQWVQQATEGIAHLHSKRVFHCNISYNNIYLDSDYKAMVGDFSGSSTDGAEPLVWYGTSHHHPDREDPSEETEIFALGSTYYEILANRNPFEGLGPGEIENSIRNGDFSALGHLPALRMVISNCWQGGYRTVDEILQDVMQEGMSIIDHSRTANTHSNFS